MRDWEQIDLLLNRLIEDLDTMGDIGAQVDARGVSECLVGILTGRAEPLAHYLRDEQ